MTAVARALAIWVVAAAVCASPARAQSAGDPPHVEAPQEHAEPPPTDHHDAAPAGLFVRAFGAVNWTATDRPGVPNSFALGQFALFATSALSERVSVLAEVVMEGSTNTRVVTDLERLQLTLRLDDRLHISAGRYHTGIGFYNAAFHHGAYFEVPIGRPRVFAFEDEGGVLPVHELGISAGGIIPGTGSTLHYLAEVGNGRSWASDGGDTEAAPDTNAAKSTNVGVSFRPERGRGLEIGGSYYRDRIWRADMGPVAHRIAAGFVVYRSPTIELMAEVLRLSHRGDAGLRSASHGGYTQLSKAWGRIRPYYRFDWLTVDPTAPFIGQTDSYRAHILGLRVDTSQWVGLKAQYEHGNDGRRQGIDSVRTQLVFVF
jgi:hypothetical protein